MLVVWVDVMKPLDALVLTAACSVIIGCGVLFVFSVQHDRAEITAFCQPRGYIGGYMDKYEGSGCIAKDQSRVSIDHIKREEAK